MIQTKRCETMRELLNLIPKIIPKDVINNENRDGTDVSSKIDSF